MRLSDKVCVVTGGGRGIGAALAQRFADEGAAGIVVCDLEDASDVARSLSVPAMGLRIDVTREADIQGAVQAAMDRFGRIDLFCSNAGVFHMGDETTVDAAWEQSWAVNVMSHVYAARSVIPVMTAQGGGYLLNTCSSAGMLTSLGAASYAATKHAAVGFAEWLSIRHAKAGIRVSALCPAAVRTEMLAQVSRAVSAQRLTSGGDLLEPADVASAVVEGLAAERFFILPHPKVGEDFRLRGADHEAWLESMRPA